MLVTFHGGGMSNTPPVVAWPKTWPHSTIAGLGEAGHHAPEDLPDEIAGAIERWLP